MEDEQSDVVRLSSVGVSESLLSGNLSNETPVENMGSENHVEECFEDGDGEEIMVEIVGSDVFVDGVSGWKEGDLGSEVVEDLAVDGRKSVVIEEVDVIISESATVEDGAVSTLSLDGLSNPGIELGTEQTEEDTKITPVIVNAEKVVKEEMVNQNSADSVLDAKVGILEKEDSVTADVAANGNERGCEGPENAQFDGIDSVVGELGLVNSKDDSLEANVKPVSVTEDETQVSFNEIDEKSLFCEKGEDTYVEFDCIVDFEGGELNINSPNSSFAGNYEFLKTDDVAHQNHVLSNDTENQPSSEIIDGQTKGVEIDSGISKGNGEIPNLEASSEDMHLSAKEKCLKARVADVLMTEDHIELDNLDTSNPDANKPEISDYQPNEVFCDISMYDVTNSNDEENNDSAIKTNGFYIKENHDLETKLMDMDEESESKPFGHFSPSDLVWGKVRSHPWWPGQIFDPSEASEKAVKYYKKDSYLVAYFGDRTFAWNEASLLKPFGPHFSHIEKQSNSEAFQNAVNSALEEVSRRVALGLACSCVSRDSYSKIKAQVVENAGIREDSRFRWGVNNPSKASNFEPEKLLKYIKELGPLASRGSPRLNLVIAKAQLTALYRFRGSRLPFEFPSCGELLDNERVMRKDKHAPGEDSHSRKERSLTELMEYSQDAEEDSVSLSSGRKRKAVDSPSTPRPSLKIGECIQRVACLLTGSKGETVINCSSNTEEHSGRKSVSFSAESFSVNEILSHLELGALDPKKWYHNLENTIQKFFLDFRSSIALNKRGRKKRAESTIGEEFEFDDVNDSYWTDRIVQNGENGNGNLQILPFDPERSRKTDCKPNSRKRFSTSELEESVKRRKQESSPAELILNFAERNCVPSEINLNKMFRRFGPLMESETEVDHETGRAKVIFKRGSDAEVALNSSGKFNIFGPVIVNYEIGYTPLISVKILPVAIPQSQEDVMLMI